MASHQLSRSAYERLKEEHYDLTTRGRIEVANKIEAARLLGDLSENGDYHAAKDEQGHMEGRIRQLEHLIENADIIDSGDDGVAGAGAVVTVMFDGDSPEDAEKYLLGHPEETPPAGASIMTLNSPLGAALVGATEGEWVEYKAPNGNTLRVQVLKVELA
jgi:transcription elongation factor GreA